MKLDPRIKQGKRPLTIFDSGTQETISLIGKDGYFSDDEIEFSEIDRFSPYFGTFGGSSGADPYPFVKNGTTKTFKFFLPVDWIEDKPKPKWKPYDIDEWKDIHNIGDTIIFRSKAFNRVQTVMYLGDSENPDNLDYVEILLGNTWYSFQQLYDCFEIFDSKYSNSVEYRPFGYLD